MSVVTDEHAPGARSEARRAALLQIARRSRIKWVLEAKDIDTEPKQSAGKTTSSVLSTSVKNTIPAAHCIQKVISFLTTVADDGEECDVESIAAGMMDYDDLEDESNLMDSETGYSPLDMNYLQPNTSSTATLSNPTPETNDVTSNEVDTFHSFLNKLLHPAATEVVKELQRFITKFLTNVHESRLKRLMQSNDEEEFKNWSRNIWDFLDFIYEMIQSSKPCQILWGNKMSNEQIIKTKEHFEKFVFKKLHGVLFGTDIEDVGLNTQTMERINSLSFLTSEHLDIQSLRILQQRYLIKQQKQRHSKQQPLPSQQQQQQQQQQPLPSQQQQQPSQQQQQQHEDDDETEFLELILQPAMKSLLKLESSHCPFDKLLCLKQCSINIASILKESRLDGSLPGADELLPMMILIIKSCNPSSLHSNIKYLQRYIRPSLLVSEAGYLLTNFISAVYFLDHVDANALTINPEEFEIKIQNSKNYGKNELKLKNIEKNEKIKENIEEDENHQMNIDILMNDYKKKIQNNNHKTFIHVSDIYKKKHPGI